MEWYQTLSRLFGRRREQMETQKKLDVHLETAAHVCPYAVSMFLLQERKAHRQQMHVSEQLSFFDKAAYVGTVMDDWDSRYRQLENIFKSPNPCASLHKFNNP